MTRYWSCISHSTAPGATLMYDDIVDTHYSYDTTVINHKAVAVGDVLLIRDTHFAYGFAVVTSIQDAPGVKMMRRCPRCGSTKISLRKTTAPRYRCSKRDCHQEFEEPVAAPMHVTTYTAHYRERWYAFSSPLPVRVLSDVYVGRDRQNAIRRLDEEALLALTGAVSNPEAQLQLELVAHTSIPSGHIDAVVRRRLGQQRFRAGLLEKYGSTCAITGPQPEAILDAAHLYNYAKVGQHSLDAGLILRTDVHRLFDRLLITIDPGRWISRVAPSILRIHPQLTSLDKVTPHLSDAARPSAALLEAHYRDARILWKAL